MISKALIAAALNLLLAFICTAQPAVEWIRTYGNGDRELFNDITVKTNGNFLMCGRKAAIINGNPGRDRSYVVGTDADGNQQWEALFGDGELREEARTIIELDNGDCAVGGTRGTGPRDTPQAFVACLSANGDLRWLRLYGEGTYGSALIELKEGPLMLAAESRANNQRSGLLIKIDTEEGAVIWRRTYGNQQGHMYFTSMRETEGGIVVVGTSFTNDMQQARLLSGKYETGAGDEIWSHSYEGALPLEGGAPSICSLPGGFAINSFARASYYDDGLDTLCLRKIDSNGNVEFLIQTDLDQDLEGVNSYWYGIARIANDDLIQIGIASYDVSHSRPFAQCLSSNGEERWHTIYRLPELGNFTDGVNGLTSVAPTPDGGAVACGTVLPRGNGQFDYNGLVMKIERLRNEPLVFYHWPEDTTLECLIGDGIRFTVRASDQLRRDINYLWIYDEVDTLSTDTSVVFTFNEFGEHIVRCQVSNGEFSSSVRWHIPVVDLYIAAFTPDTLNLAVRRSASIEFSLDTVRCTEGAEPEYLWTKNNLDNQEREEAGSEPHANVSFLQSGNYTVEGLAYRGESSDAVVWNVGVRGVIWSFQPETLSLSVQVGEQLAFEVYPSNPDTGQIGYSWTQDGEVVGTDSALVFQSDRVGVHLLTGKVTEGAEADSVTWTFDVTPLGVRNDRSGQAGTPILLRVTPNPFNSSTTIEYSLPRPGRYAVDVVDISGRLVERIAGGYGQAGSHQTVWNAGSTAAGVYIVKLEGGRIRDLKKVVLVK